MSGRSGGSPARAERIAVPPNLRAAPVPRLLCAMEHRKCLPETSDPRSGAFFGSEVEKAKSRGSDSPHRFHGGCCADVPHHRSRGRSRGDGRPGARSRRTGPAADPGGVRRGVPGRRPGRRVHHPAPDRRRLSGGAARGRRRGRARRPRADRAGQPVRRRPGRDDAGNGETTVSYLNVAEVETALALAARPENAAFTELTTLPYRTWEGRTSSALRIHAGPPARAGVYLLGGVHAREWGSSDLLINSVQLLTDAYRTGTGITQGGASLGANDVQRIVTSLDVVVFPQANPDGRHHSMTADPMWRKNRRPRTRDNRPARAAGDRDPASTSTATTTSSGTIPSRSARRPRWRPPPNPAMRSTAAPARPPNPKPPTSPGCWTSTRR